jgi:hypothetical protein
MNTALVYSTRVVQEGGRRCKKSTLNDLVHLTPLRIPLMNPPYAALGVTVIACVPAVTSIPAIAGVLLVPDFFSVSGLPPCC